VIDASLAWTGGSWSSWRWMTSRAALRRYRCCRTCAAQLVHTARTLAVGARAPAQATLVRW